MKLFLTLSAMLSLFSNTNSFAQTAITSLNQYENTFVKVTRIPGTENDPQINVMTCSGTPSAPVGCANLGSRNSYWVKELETRRSTLRAEGSGMVGLDLLVVGAGAASGGAAFGAGTIIASIITDGSVSLAVIGTGVGAGAVTGVAADGLVKKLNPMTEFHEATDLSKIINGDAKVKSIKDFIDDLRAALTY